MTDPEELNPLQGNPNEVGALGLHPAIEEQLLAAAATRGNSYRLRANWPRRQQRVDELTRSRIRLDRAIRIRRIAGQIDDLRARGHRDRALEEQIRGRNVPTDTVATLEFNRRVVMTELRTIENIGDMEPQQELPVAPLPVGEEPAPNPLILPQVEESQPPEQQQDDEQDGEEEVDREHELRAARQREMALYEIAHRAVNELEFEIYELDVRRPPGYDNMIARLRLLRYFERITQIRSLNAEAELYHYLQGNEEPFVPPFQVIHPPEGQPPQDPVNIGRIIRDRDVTAQDIDEILALLPFQSYPQYTGGPLWGAEEIERRRVDVEAVYSEPFVPDKLFKYVYRVLLPDSGYPRGIRRHTGEPIDYSDSMPRNIVLYNPFPDHRSEAHRLLRGQMDVAGLMYGYPDIPRTNVVPDENIVGQNQYQPYLFTGYNEQAQYFKRFAEMEERYENVHPAEFPDHTLAFFRIMDIVYSERRRTYYGIRWFIDPPYLAQVSRYYADKLAFFIWKHGQDKGDVGWLDPYDPSPQDRMIYLPPTISKRQVLPLRLVFMDGNMVLIPKNVSQIRFPDGRLGRWFTEQERVLRQILTDDHTPEWGRPIRHVRRGRIVETGPLVRLLDDRPIERRRLAPEGGSREIWHGREPTRPYLIIDPDANIPRDATAEELVDRTFDDQGLIRDADDDFIHEVGLPLPQDEIAVQNVPDDIIINEHPLLLREIRELTKNRTRQLIAAQVLLPFDGRVLSREVAFLTTARDIMEFVNWYQRDNRRMHGLSLRYRSLIIESTVDYLDNHEDINLLQAQSILWTLYNEGNTLVTFLGYYSFRLLGVDPQSPLHRDGVLPPEYDEAQNNDDPNNPVRMGRGITTMGLYSAPRFVQREGNEYVRERTIPDERGRFPMTEYAITFIEDEGDGSVLRPYMFRIEFSEPIHSRDVAFHHMTRLFNTLIGQPGPWRSPGQHNYTMRKQYERFVRQFFRDYVNGLPLESNLILLSRFSMHPFALEHEWDDPPFMGGYGNVINHLRIYPLPALFQMIDEFTARYRDRIDRTVRGEAIREIDLSVWFMELAVVPREYNLVSGFRQIPLTLQVNKELDVEGRFIDDRRLSRLHPRENPFIVIDPSEDRIRLNKYCLAMVVWLGIDLRRLERPRVTWLESARSWIYSVCRRVGIPNIYKGRRKFISDKLLFETVLLGFTTDRQRKKCFVVIDRNYHWRQCYWLDPDDPKVVHTADYHDTSRYPSALRSLKKIYVLKIETHAFLALFRKTYPQYAHLNTSPYSINPAVKYRWTQPARAMAYEKFFIVGDTETYPHPKDKSEVVYMAQLADRYKTRIWCLEPSPTCIDEVPYNYLNDLVELKKKEQKNVEIVITPNPVKAKIEFLIEHSSWYHGQILFYHNLSGFDFILTFREFMKCGFDFVGQPLSGPYGGVGRVQAVHSNELVTVPTGKEDEHGNRIMKDTHYKIILSDSYSLFSQALSTLTKSLGVTHSKLEFDTLSVTHENYVKKMVEIIPYAVNDVRGLYEVLKIMGERMLEHGCNYMCCPTSTSISNRTFLVKYYKPWIAPIYNLSYRDSEFISRSYHGGRTECFHLGVIPVGPNQHIEFYDINSAYPDKMCKDLPVGAPFKVDLRSDDIHVKGQARFIGKWRALMKGKREKYTDTEFDKRKRVVQYEDFENEMFFGFIACLVVGGYSDEHTIPILPYKHKGKNIYPIFRKPTYQVLTTAFLDEIWEKGLPYQVQFLDEAFHFKPYPIFREFVLHFYALRQIAKETGDKSADMMLKAILNQLYGRTAFERVRKYFEFVSGETDLLDPQYQYDRGILQAIRFKSQIMLQKVGFCDTKLAAVNIAAFVTSRAQIHMHQALHKVRTSKDATLLYCDTDSVLMVTPTNERELKPSRFPISKKLGEWDYEGGPYNFGCINQKKNYYLASKKLYQNPSGLTDPKKIREEKLKHYGLSPEPTDDETDGLILKHEKGLKKFGFKGIKRKVADAFYWKTWEMIARGKKISIVQLNSKSGLQTYFSPKHCGKIYRRPMKKCVSRNEYTDGMTDRWDFPKFNYVGPVKPLVLPIITDEIDQTDFIKQLQNKDWFYGYKIEK